MEDSKQQCITDTATMDQSTNIDTTGNTLMVMDLDELQAAYESKCDALQQQIKEQWMAMDNMRDQLTQQFEQQLKQLELKMDTNSKQLFYDFDQRFQMVMNKMEALVIDHNEMNTMIEERMNQILQAINGTNSGDITPTISNTQQHPHKMACPTLSPAPTTTAMNINQSTQANRSLPTNPPASHTNHTYDGSNALAGAYK